MHILCAISFCANHSFSEGWSPFLCGENLNQDFQDFRMVRMVHSLPVSVSLSVSLSLSSFLAV